LGRGRGSAKVHGVVRPGVTLVGTAAAVVDGPVSVAGHDDIIKAVRQVSDIMPGHVHRDLTDEQLLDSGLETTDEVEPEVHSVSLGQVGDELLELVGVLLDGGELSKLAEGGAGFVVRLRVSHALGEGVGELLEGSEACVLLFAVGSSGTLGLEPRVGSSSQVGRGVSDAVRPVEVEAGH
jgi:hypothetical protein